MTMQCVAHPEGLHEGPVPDVEGDAKDSTTHAPLGQSECRCVDSLTNSRPKSPQGYRRADSTESTQGLEPVGYRPAPP
eukprot:CAMPEP_0174377058 /NCGR_PEP_ID=MMETSP0811_2-20130205/120650_1 /TAXON_ID=73025 ORGANISM="Eutreptiella gymnastica-like, Strain CCMP1594" /NCGR_SAMPLE_ID=MMETSP0811_2 /ASSEMBLY_ACC=CAM_ASM_000667 /LENGTH=77 /DNA_ID=CAMNT_0015528925 /DNA_START=108 /DNA_END=337 /DNA_ORIENTATION=-